MEQNAQQLLEDSLFTVVDGNEYYRALTYHQNIVIIFSESFFDCYIVDCKLNQLVYLTKNLSTLKIEEFLNNLTSLVNFIKQNSL